MKTLVREALEFCELSLMGDNGEKLEDHNDDRHTHCKDQAKELFVLKGLH